MGVQTIASVRDETLPVDFSRTAAERYQIKYKLCAWIFPLPDRVGKEGHPPSPLAQSLN